MESKRFRLKAYCVHQAADNRMSKEVYRLVVRGPRVTIFFAESTSTLVGRCCISVKAANKLFRNERLNLAGLRRSRTSNYSHEKLHKAIALQSLLQWFVAPSELRFTIWSWIIATLHEVTLRHSWKTAQRSFECWYDFLCSWRRMMFSWWTFWMICRNVINKIINISVECRERISFNHRKNEVAEVNLPYLIRWFQWTPSRQAF